MCAKRDRKPGFDSEFDGAILKIKLRGEIDHHAAAVVRVNIDELIHSRSPKTLLLDMSAVDFMDSSGLGLIMGRFSLMQASGGEMFILDPSPATERIMKLAGMERLVKIKRTGIPVGGVQKRAAEREIKRRSTRHRAARENAVVSSVAISQKGKTEDDKRGERK